MSDGYKVLGKDFWGWDMIDGGKEDGFLNKLNKSWQMKPSETLPELPVKKLAPNLLTSSHLFILEWLFLYFIDFFLCFIRRPFCERIFNSFKMDL